MDWPLNSSGFRVLVNAAAGFLGAWTDRMPALAIVRYGQEAPEVYRCGFTNRYPEQRASILEEIACARSRHFGDHSRRETAMPEWRADRGGAGSSVCRARTVDLQLPKRQAFEAGQRGIARTKASSANTHTQCISRRRIVAMPALRGRAPTLPELQRQAGRICTAQRETLLDCATKSY